jgi:hypothetical protein
LPKVIEDGTTDCSSKVAVPVESENGGGAINRTYASTTAFRRQLVYFFTKQKQEKKPMVFFLFLSNFGSYFYAFWHLFSQISKLEISMMGKLD